MMPKLITEENRVQLISDVKHTFASDAGINTLRFIADYCLEHSNPYVPGQFDQTARNCGKLEVILKIRKLLAEDGLPRQEKVITEKAED